MSVSTATRLRGSCVSMASRIESLIWSAILSGWPSVTDSEVKRRRGTRYSLRSAGAPGGSRSGGGGARPRGGRRGPPAVVRGADGGGPGREGTGGRRQVRALEVRWDRSSAPRRQDGGHRVPD